MTCLVAYADTEQNPADQKLSESLDTSTPDHCDETKDSCNKNSTAATEEILVQRVGEIAEDTGEDIRGGVDEGEHPDIVRQAAIEATC